MVTVSRRERSVKSAPTLSHLPPVVVQSLGAALESHPIEVQGGSYEVDFIVRIRGTVNFNSHGEAVSHDLKIEHDPSRKSVERQYVYVSIRDQQGREVKGGFIAERESAERQAAFFNQISSPKFTAQIERDAKIRISA